MQSFCRRKPNHKGSNYCKLHYFDPRYRSRISEFQDPTTDETEVSNRCCEIASVHAASAGTEKEEGGETRPLILGDSTNAAITGAIYTDHLALTTTCTTRNSGGSSICCRKPHHRRRVPRDRLYRGSSSPTNGDGGGSVEEEQEVRCLAISTRGKRCCYAAVVSNGNRYCHRHSSFFEDSTANVAGAVAASDEKHCHPFGKPPTEGEAPSFDSPEMGSDAVALAGEESNRPPSALSDLSTDLWQNRRVLISKGPHESRIGIVVRWRNGWVTVALVLSPGEEEPKNARGTTPSTITTNEIYHNRRSYELFLV
jgi:hypothetical protein